MLLQRDEPIVGAEAPRSAFEQRFGVAPDSVLAAMDRDGDDPARQRPSIALAIQAVGFDRRDVPVTLAARNGGPATTLQCHVRVRTELPAAYRGIHVSRLGDVLAELTTRTFEDLLDYARVCAAAVAERQYAGATQVEIEGRLAIVTSVASREGGRPKGSLDTVGVHALHRRSEQGQRSEAGIEVDHIVACPCVQQTLKHTARLSPLIPEVAAGYLPLLTHSQRCRTRVTVGGAGALPAVEALLGALDGAVLRTQSTLPREHELLLVYEAHRRPQFLEDVLRQVAGATTSVCQGLEDEARVTVSSTSLESIHEFDLSGTGSWSLHELRAEGSEG